MSVIAGDQSVFSLGPDDPGRGVGLGPGVRLVRVPGSRRFDAAVRLVGDQTEDPPAAAERFLESAAAMGIDLSLMWATESGGRGGTLGTLRQVSLAVPGSGRTVMVFVSGPARRRRGSLVSVVELGAGAGPTRERAAVIRAACEAAASGGAGPESVLAQSLLETRETEAIAGFVAAGFRQIGDLAYLRRLGTAPAASAGDELPASVQVRSIAGLIGEGWTPERVEEALLMALERSYIDTLDCPELCGLRSVRDVLESHRAVGRYDGSLWWLVFEHGRAEGCMLLTVCPEHESVELVYLGLSPVLRGRGLGAKLLNGGLRVVLGAAASFGEASTGVGRCMVGVGGVTCAVDTRNEPAMRLYRRTGFERFALRVPMVLPLRAATT